jgi:hypothetical protein
MPCDCLIVGLIDFQQSVEERRPIILLTDDTRSDSKKLAIQATLDKHFFLPEAQFFGIIVTDVSS